MAARPQVSVYGLDGKETGTTALPYAFLAPIRHDIVRFVHTNINKNARQAYGVTRRQGHRVTAESWGTGRAVARIPRVGGGGTHRSGEGAYGNMCRGGRMFAPNKVYRRWHRRVNKNLRRYAVASALAATALPPLVLARGHKIEKVPELPLVLSNKVETISKTKEAVAVLKALQAYSDVEKVKGTRKLRPGIGKIRNRRYINRKGPLLILGQKGSGWKAFRNLPGVDIAYGSALNLLQLAPGGHLGRFVIFSESAFNDLTKWFGDATNAATARKYKLPRSIVSNTDVTRVINSTELQSVLRKKRRSTKPKAIRRNPLRNNGEYTKLSPYSKVLRNRIRKQVKKTVQKATGGKATAAKPAAKSAAKPVAKNATAKPAKK